MTDHPKWIFYCEDANLELAAIAAQKLCRRAILGDVPPEDLNVIYEFGFDNDILMQGTAESDGTFIIRQVL